MNKVQTGETMTQPLTKSIPQRLQFLGIFLLSVFLLIPIFIQVRTRNSVSLPIENRTKSESRFDIQMIVSKVEIGTTEDELVGIMQPVSLGSRCIYWGGTGRRRIYFRMEPEKQIWFELSGPIDGERVAFIGEVENYTHWTNDNE
ncbi:MAG: hypothetical protein AAGA30_09590 [Planctomycetota bacterium]